MRESTFKKKIKRKEQEFKDEGYGFSSVAEHIPIHGRPGLQYSIPQKKREGGRRCKREARDEPRTQKSKSAASKQNKFGETVTGKFMHHTETLVLFL